MSNAIKDAAAAIRNADAILIGAGAGMGVDSGLPDFRGNQGFWKAYPPFQELGLSFIDLANPRWFIDDPALAWGFYGHRLNLYRDTLPHEGFALLRKWSDALPSGAFVFTSNVDGQFQRAGVADSRVMECHGSIHHLQCAKGCTDEIWEATGAVVDIDADFRATSALPKCSACGGIARPNILMFGDFGWLDARTDDQHRRMQTWFDSVERPVVIECGAGTAIPSVRHVCEGVGRRPGSTLVRINPRESQGPSGTISIASGALDALRQIDEQL